MKSLKWEVRQRFTLLEASLIWSGRVIRRDLISRFGISNIQASKDFTHYQTLFPDNLVYDKSKRCYVASSYFKPAFLQGTSEEFFHLLKSAPFEEKSPTVVLLGDIPSTEILLPLDRKTPVGILQKMNLAIRERLELSVSYQSMNRNAPAELQLSPHSIIHNGFRWHVRAWSASHREFRDFLLARIKAIPELIGQASIENKSDEKWNRYVDVKIGPHPGLSDAAASVIADDYGMSDGYIIKSLRAALAGYFIRLMKVGKDDENRNPKEQQIILLNKDELEEFIF